MGLDRGQKGNSARLVHPSCTAVDALFPGFESRLIGTSRSEIFCRTAGSGPPLLLLHGYPQTHAVWHRVAPVLARRFTVVLMDLPGYGGSAAADRDVSVAASSKRAAAAEICDAMERLGHRRFGVAGHDRGGRVAHRMALDAPERIERVAFLDIVPTLYRFDHVDMAIATKAYHWFFLIQPAPLPERMIGADPAFFLEHTLNSWAARPGFWHEDAYAGYLAALTDPHIVHATCNDYRASASIDLEHDRADRDRLVEAPALVLWGEASPQASSYTVLGVWRRFARCVIGEPIVSGHFLAEEAAEETAERLGEFFAGSAQRTISPTEGAA